MKRINRKIIPRQVSSQRNFAVCIKIGHAHKTRDEYNGAALPAPKNVVPIQVDPTTNRLSFHVDDMTPGTYQMRAFVAYRGEDDESRIYSQIYNPNTAAIDNAVTFQVSPSSSLGTSIAVAPLYLDLSGSVCPNP